MDGWRGAILIEIVMMIRRVDSGALDYHNYNE
jgi:hypothetical protein